jgi:hypothetical protein
MMQLISKSFVLSLALGLLAMGQTNAQSRAEVKPLTEAEARPILIQVAHKVERLSMSRDPELFNKMAADNFVDVDPDGKVFTKQQEMEIMKSSDLKLDSFELSDVQTHLYGNTALIIATSHVKGHYKGEDLTGSYRVVELFQRGATLTGRSADDWLMVSCSGVRLNSLRN